MNNFKTKLSCDSPKLFHWGNAEKIQFRNVKKYHKKYNLPELNFIDLLDIFKNEPITIKNAYNFGLKNIGETMYNHKMISTIWDDKNIDGKEAMIYAWDAHNIAYKNKKSMKNIQLIKEISKYNYFDCKVIQEITEYIRNNLM